jgi:hypothetical protein
MSESSKWNAAESTFVDQFVRRLLVGWAEHAIVHGSIPVVEHSHVQFLTYASDKGWITKREPKTLTAKGWNTAASFMKG